MAATATASFHDVRKFLQASSLGSFVDDVAIGALGANQPRRPQTLVTLRTSTTVDEALRALEQTRILSAPVLDERGEYVGILDVADVLRGLMLHAYPELLDADFVGTHRTLSTSELQALGPEFAAQPVGSFLHGGDLWYRGDAASNLFEVVQQGFRVPLPTAVHNPQHHARVHHRVAVFDIHPGQQTPDGPLPEWRIVSVISQSDVLRALAARADELDARLWDGSVADLGLVSSKVATVAADVPAVAAFGRMQAAGHTGLGIVDGAGALIGNLSASDLRGIRPERFGSLALPVAEFVALQAGRGSWEDVLFGKHAAGVAGGDWRAVLSDLPLLACTPGDSLKSVARRLAGAGLHRMYVTDAGGRAVGVITLTDILRRLIL